MALIEGLRAKRSTAAKNASVSRSAFAELKGPLECERKFIIHKTSLLQHVNLDLLPQLNIRQDYFPRSLVLSMATMIGAIEGRKIDSSVIEHLSQARVRRVRSDKGEKYYLEAKGPRAVNDGARLEISVEIDYERYRNLRRFASDGRIDKVRYLFETKYLGRDGSFGILNAELDQLLRIAGRDVSNKRWNSFFTIDLEFANRAQLVAFSEDQPTVSTLLSAIELTNNRPHLRKALSTRRLARRGFDRHAKSAILEIFGAQFNSIT